jgi:YbbR domain-containing protein
MTLMRRWVFNDFGLKLFSLVMAFLLWAVVSRDPVTEVQLSSAIEFHGVPDNMEVSSVSLPQAQLRLRGPSRLVNRLGPGNVHVQLDLADVHPGERTFPLSAQNVSLPEGVEVVQIVPSEVHIHFDQRSTRIVSVEPRVTGKLASGFTITKVSSDPAQVTITGPQKRVSLVDSATTDPVDATGVLGRGSFTTNAYVTDPLVQVVNPQPVRVTVVVGRAGTTPE